MTLKEALAAKSAHVYGLFDEDRNNIAENDWYTDHNEAIRGLNMKRTKHPARRYMLYRERSENMKV